MKKRFFLALSLAAVVILAFLLTGSSRSEEIINGNDSSSVGNSEIKENAGYVAVSANNIPGAAQEFSFSFSMLDEWDTEAVGGGRVLNIYDPGADGDNSLEKSQIFSWFFRANNFQTIDSVNILSRVDREINGRQAVTYVISKKENTPDFAGEPSWRNNTHKAVDIRLSDENPTLFFVFAKSPSLSDAEFERFLDSIIFDQQ